MDLHLQPGWMDRQLDRAAADFAAWPEWMQAAARRDWEQEEQERCNLAMGKKPTQEQA